MKLSRRKQKSGRKGPHEKWGEWEMNARRGEKGGILQSPVARGTLAAGPKRKAAIESQNEASKGICNDAQTAQAKTPKK